MYSSGSARLPSMEGAAGFFQTRKLRCQTEKTHNGDVAHGVVGLSPIRPLGGCREIHGTSVFLLWCRYPPSVGRLEVGMSWIRLLLLCLLLSAQAEAETIRFAPLPLVDEKTLRAEYLPLLRLPLQQTGDAYRLILLKYPAMLQATRTAMFDLAILGPLPYIKLTERANTSSSRSSARRTTPITTAYWSPSAPTVPEAEGHQGANASA